MSNLNRGPRPDVFRPGPVRKSDKPAVRLVKPVPAWRGAWVSGLWCAWLPLAAVVGSGVLMHMVRRGIINPNGWLPAAWVAVAVVVLSVARLLTLAALVCALVVMVRGAFFRGLFILLLSLPVWLIAGW